MKSSFFNPLIIFHTASMHFAYIMSISQNQFSCYITSLYPLFYAQVTTLFRQVAVMQSKLNAFISKLHQFYYEEIKAFGSGKFYRELFNLIGNLKYRTLANNYINKFSYNLN